MDSVTRILLIERDPAYADLVQRLLEETTEGKATLEHAESIDLAVSLIEQARHDLILVDLSETALGGLDDVTKLLALAPHAHLVVLASEQNETIATAAVKLGAQDFLLKGEISFRQLSRAVRFAMERGRNLARLSALAVYDELTGLERRASVAEKYRAAIAGADRRGKYIGVIYVDLDGFKAINDRHGHGVGDNVLIEVASRLRQAIRRADTVGRFGGDEFVIVATDLKDRADLERIEQKVRASLSVPVWMDETAFKLSASLGSAMATLDDIDKFETVLHRADSAMYAEKKSRKALRDKEQSLVN